METPLIGTDSQKYSQRKILKSTLKEKDMKYKKENGNTADRHKCSNLNPKSISFPYMLSQTHSSNKHRF
jgi:hypothetical protein